jgi:hypothetical protein
MPAKKSGRGVHRSVADLQVGRKSAFRATPSYADKINFTMTMASEPGMPNSRMFPVFLLWLLYGDVGWGVRKSRNAAVSALGVTKGMAQAFFRAIEGSPFLCRDARIESSTSALRPTVFKFQPFLCGRQLPTGERSATPDR